jgi:hypothetical protein
MEVGGNASIILFQRRVLLEVFDQKYFFHLSYIRYAVRLYVVGIKPRLGLMCIQGSQSVKRVCKTFMKLKRILRFCFLNQEQSEQSVNISLPENEFR